MKAKIINKTKITISEEKAKKYSTIGIFAIIILLIIAVLWYFLTPKKYSYVTYSFDAYVSQNIYGTNAEESAKKAADAIASLEDLLSFDGENSEIALINENAGDKWTEISDVTYNVLSEALRLCELTGGDFDITLAPVSRLYRLSDNNFSVPDDDLINEYKNYIDYTELRLDETEKSASFAHFGYAVDLYEILMGAACDLAIEVYTSNGITSAAIIVGDNVGIIGTKPDGEKWETIINTPKNDAELGVIKIDEGFISVVSKYERYIESDGKEYHYIINPNTGLPTNNNLESVIVISKSGAESSALAYASFIKGYNKSHDLINENDAFAIFVFEDNTVRIHGETGIFTLTNKDYRLR